VLIPFTQPMDLESTLESGQAFRWRRGQSDSPDHPWFWGVVFDNLVKIRRTEDGVEFFSAPDGEVRLSALLQDYLRLRDDLSSIYQSIDTDERVRAGIDDYTGMRILRQDPWECLISFMCSSASNIPRISKNVEDMGRNFGRPLSLEGQSRHTFPTARELAVAGEARLRELGLGFRAAYVEKVAEIAAEGRIDLFTLREASYDDALAELTALPGVGDKVANCVMLFSLDKLEAFPIDVWIKRALEEWYLSERPGGAKLVARELRPWAQQHFGPYAGYANQYLFHKRRLQGKGARA